MDKIKEKLKRKSFIGGILFLLGSLVYGNILWGGFVFDDNLLVENNQLIRSLGNIKEFFTANSQSGAGVEGSNFYRPMQYLVYALTYKIAGLNASVFHAVSVLFHILNSFLVFVLLTRLNFSRMGALLGSIVFLIHPVTTESISYISGIADPLGLCFLLGGLLIFLKLKSFNIYKILGLFVCVILALLSKESTIIFWPLMILLLIFQWGGLKKKEQNLKLQVIGGGGLLAGFYLIAKFTIFDFTGNGGLTSETNIYTENIEIRVITFISILKEYAQILIYPTDLYLERPYTAYVNLYSFRGIFGILILLLGSLFAYKSWFKKKTFFLGVMWFFIALMPMSGLIPLNAIYLEHWLYFPLVGISILVAGLWGQLQAKKAQRIFLIGFLIVGILASMRTVLRNIEWGDPVKFYKNELFYSPKSARIHHNLGMEYMHQGLIFFGIDHYEKALEIRPDYPQIYNNLGYAFIQLGQLEKAKENFLKALELSPNFRYSLDGLKIIEKIKSEK